MGTVVVGGLVFAAVAYACYSLYRDKKNGKHCGGCSGNCASCNKKLSEKGG